MRKSKDDNQIIAMVYYACPICGTKDETQSDLLINMKLQDMKPVDKQIIGFGNPCSQCQAELDQGAIMLVVVDQSKSSGTKLDELYRTGNIFGLSEEWAKRALQGEALEHALKTRILIIDYKDAIQIGLPVEYKP